MSIKFSVVTEQTRKFICVTEDCHSTELGDHPFVKDHILLIKKAIQDNDAQKLEDYLTYTMQFSNIIDWKQGHWGEHDDYHVPSQYWLHTCSVVEGLLRLFPQHLEEIIKLIADKNDMKLYQAFVKSLESSSLSEEKLFAWNNNLKTKIQTGIASLKAYAYGTLEKQHSNKAQAVIEITNQLTKKIELLETRTYNDAEGSCLLENAPNFIAKLRTLQFKLEFNSILHSKDEILKKHRGYAKLAGNLFSLLFTGGILNVVNYAVNGKFWFFNQTKTQSMANGLEKTVLNSKKFGI